MSADREVVARVFYEGCKARAEELGGCGLSNVGWGDRSPDALTCREIFTAGADAIIASGLAH